MAPAILAGAFLLLGGPALASVIFQKPVTLQRVLELSSHVLVVTHADPSSTTKKIAVTTKNSGKKKGKKKAPVFEAVTFHYVVGEVLFPDSEADALVGKVVNVVPAYQDTRLQMFRSYHLKKVVPSPIFESYAPEGADASPATWDDQDASARIVFLSLLDPARKLYRYVVENAMESVDGRQQVLDKLAEVHPPVKEDESGESACFP